MLLPSHRRPGAASFVLEGMKALAPDRGFAELVGPVRPTLKHRYALTPFERYVGWGRADGQPFDPWVRAHVSLGGTVVAPCWGSMRVEGRVADWERWTGSPCRSRGPTSSPGRWCRWRSTASAIAGRYVEPNLWNHHPV